MGDPALVDGDDASHLALNLRGYLDFPLDVCEEYVDLAGVDGVDGGVSGCILLMCLRYPCFEGARGATLTLTIFAKSMCS